MTTEEETTTVIKNPFVPKAAYDEVAAELDRVQEAFDRAKPVIDAARAWAAQYTVRPAVTHGAPTYALSAVAVLLAAVDAYDTAQKAPDLLHRLELRDEPRDPDCGCPLSGEYHTCGRTFRPGMEGVLKAPEPVEPFSDEDAAEDDASLLRTTARMLAKVQADRARLEDELGRVQEAYDRAKARVEELELVAAVSGIGTDPNGYYAGTPGFRVRQLQTAEAELDRGVDLDEAIEAAKRAVRELEAMTRDGYLEQRVEIDAAIRAAAPIIRRAAERERDEARAQVTELEDSVNLMAHVIDDRAALRAQLADARRAILNEAADALLKHRIDLHDSWAGYRNSVRDGRLGGIEEAATLLRERAKRGD